MTSYLQITSMSALTYAYTQMSGEYYYRTIIKRGDVGAYVVKDIAELASDLRFGLRELVQTRFEIFEKANPKLRSRAQRERYVDEVLNESFAAFGLPFKAEQLKQKAVKK